MTANPSVPEQAQAMLALTVMQPWADAIAHGGKRVENRFWAAPRHIIGRNIAIHAGKRFDWDAMFTPGLMPLWKPPEDVPLGAVVAVARVADCHRWESGWQPDPMCSPWAAMGQYHWVLEDVRPLPEPVPARGFQRLWKLSPETYADVRLVLEKVAAG